MNLQCTPPSTPLIIGHRGAKGHVAENTLPSIARAMELGVDGIEIDIFLCKSVNWWFFMTKNWTD